MAISKKKFKFSLETVLRHRKNVEDEARVGLAIIRAELLEAEAALQRLLDEKSSALAERHVIASGGGAAASSLSQVNQFLVLQDIRIERQRKAIAEVESRVEKCLEVLRQRAMESKIVERLKERKLEEFKIENSKAEQKMTDDMVTTRYASQMGKGK